MTPLHGVRVLVWGLGTHGGGLAAAQLCAAEGAQVEILDTRPPAADPGFACHQGDASHPAFSAAELIVPSPAIPPRAWPAAHPPAISPEALALERHRGRRVAVTGTKGKSSTAMLTGLLLGWRVAGNSWPPLAAAVLDDPTADLVVELSSFQLWYLRQCRPRFEVAILTQLAIDHLDWHPDAGHYHAAKLALLGWAAAVAAAPETHSLLPTGLPFLDLPAPPDAADLRLPGAHNRANARLALAAARHLGVPDHELLPRLRQAEPLPHRLRTVHATGSLVFVDDSIATTPEAAMAGLASFAGPLAVILGGSDKGAAFSTLAAAVRTRGAHPVLLGATAPRLAEALATHGCTAPIASDLDDALRRAVAALTGGGTVLLSPACASFDLFRGFEDRGDRFAEAARRLFP